MNHLLLPFGASAGAIALQFGVLCFLAAAVIHSLHRAFEVAVADLRILLALLVPVSIMAANPNVHGWVFLALVLAGLAGHFSSVALWRFMGKRSPETP